jgi:hypothetical protein
MVAVKPPILFQVINYLLRELPNVEIVSYLKEGDSLVRHAQRLLPNVIIVNDRCLSVDIRRSISNLKNASPGCKLIFTSWPESELVPGFRSGADAQLDEATLTRRLIPTVNRLVRSCCDCKAAPRRAGRR